MQAWRIAKEKFALDRLGTGALSMGGRWNSLGVAVIYAGMHRSLCALEKLVHTSNMMISDLVLVSIQLPDSDTLYKQYDVAELLSDWDALPSSTAAMTVGDQFVRDQKYLGMMVPSVLMPEEYNLIINPNHPEFRHVQFQIERPFVFDKRLREG